MTSVPKGTLYVSEDGMHDVTSALTAGLRAGAVSAGGPRSGSGSSRHSARLPSLAARGRTATQTDSACTAPAPPRPAPSRPATSRLRARFWHKTDTGVTQAYKSHTGVLPRPHRAVSPPTPPPPPTPSQTSKARTEQKLQVFSVLRQDGYSLQNDKHLII